MKYVVVTGGVLSGLGKGITASSIGVLLKSAGLRVTSVKIDPYLNCDAGTMSPFEHGEVYVLDDGGEVDLDLGNYERFLDISLTKDNNITTGKVYQSVIERERRGDYLGKTVQVIPHITNEIQEWIERVAETPSDGSGKTPDACVIELGGTVGDIESAPFVEALRQFQFRVGEENICFVHVSLVPVMGPVGEQKTKPTQHTVNVNGTRNILDAARRYGIRVFIPSSIAVFGPDAPKHAPQITALNPTTKYGQTKVDCEIMGMLYWKKYGVDVRGIRYPGLISWKSQVSGGTTDYAVDIFHAALSEKKSYDCFLNGDTTLPMMYMDEAIRATISLMDAPLETLSSARCGYNISGLSFCAEDLSSEIKKHIPNFICNYKPDVRQNYADSWPDSIDDEIARNDWNWEPSFDLVEIVEDMIENLS